MHNIYNEIILEVSKKFKITETEVERIIDSQFKYVTNIVNEKSDKTIQLIYIGKFTPNKYKNFIKYQNDKKAKELLNTIKTDNPS